MAKHAVIDGINMAVLKAFKRPLEELLKDDRILKINRAKSMPRSSQVLGFHFQDYRDGALLYKAYSENGGHVFHFVVSEEDAAEVRISIDETCGKYFK